MTAERMVKLTLTPTSGPGSRVVVNGTDITSAIRGLTLRAAAGETTRMEIDLTMLTATVDGVAELVVRPAARDLLISHGWTPPGPGNEPSVPVGELPSEPARNEPTSAPVVIPHAVYEPVYELIRNLGDALPQDVVRRNALMWRAVHAALDAFRSVPSEPSSAPNERANAPVSAPNEPDQEGRE